MDKKRLFFTIASITLTAFIIFTGSTFRSEIITHGNTRDIKTYGFEYFPLNEENTLIYNSNFGETRSNVKRIDDELIVVNESEDFRYVQNFLVKDNGIYITRTEQYLSVFLFISSEAKISYNEPALRIPMPLNESSRWKWEGIEYKDEDTSKIVIEGKYIGTQMLETPAGKFNCVNIELNVASEKGSSSVVNEWLAPGVGLVKLHAKLEGAGLLGILQNVFGYDEIYFELKEII